LLTSLLIDRLTSSNAKVIQTSSVGARVFGHIDISDLNNTRKWTPSKAYGDSKLANILFTRELHRRHHDQGISAVAFHPGNVATSFASDTSSWIRFVYRRPLAKMLTTPDKGGAELAWFAEGVPGVTWKSGEYYENHHTSPARKINPQARDDALAEILWERSTAMSGLTSA
jgi:NAD(P)-dependent dehydrogenase (short-subunit alcohol dehydrogenase family)